MITILTTTEHLSTVSEIIDAVYRLNELVEVTEHNEFIRMGDKVLVVDDFGIKTQIDWFDTEPPYLFPEVQFNQTNLLAMVYYKLGNEQQAFEYLKETDELYHHLLLATKLKFGYEIDIENLNISLLHNKAILQHYGNVSNRNSFNEIRQLYAVALQTAQENEARSFTAKHYVNLLLDAQLFEDAVFACESFLKEASSKEANMALKIQWCGASYKNLQIPYDAKILEKIQMMQEECINYLKENELGLNAALLAMEAGDVANFMGDYPKAKDFINWAIKVFKEEDILDFLGEAGLKKAHLLYNWSKNGSPQYYKASINAFQDVLKIFKKDVYPNYFAEIQHSLALIYSEIPAPPDEKSMWTAFSASAFKEAMEYYSKDAFPYEYAMVCHNYATALMDFPPAKLHNNYEKAHGLFGEALRIRTAEKYPLERALTLLNQLELEWVMHNSNEAEEEKRLRLMKEKAEVVLTLVSDENLLIRAQEQLKKLEKLKTII